MLAGAEGDLLLELELSANLLITCLSVARLVRVCAAFLGMRGVDERDGFPRSVRPARVPALPDVDAVLGFRLLLGDSSSESGSSGVSPTLESARRDRAVELPGFVDFWSDSHSQDCAELDAFLSLAPLADRARPGGEPRSAMRLPLNFCFFLASPSVSVALIIDNSVTACLSLAFPLIASATIFFALIF